MAAKFFDPDQTLIYFAGIRIQGWANGEYISWERLTPAFQEEVGTDGEVCRSKSNDKRVKVTIKLLQSSLTNKALSIIHNKDIDGTNGAGVGTFLAQDLQGNTIINGAQTWIVKFPEGSWDRTAKAREWELRIAEAAQIEGGNGT
jgi:hypothetical protein